MAGSGFIIGGKKYLVPGVDVINWEDDPIHVPPVTDFYKRATFIRGGVLHTVHGKMGKLLPGLKKVSNAGESYARYQAHTARDVSWDGTMDMDGAMLWQNDPLKRATWHAGGANEETFGIESVQEDNGDQYEQQVNNQVACLNVLSGVLEFPRQVPIQRVNGIVEPDLKYIPRSPTDFYGCYGHCNQTSNKGAGDPGPHIFRALLRAGWMGFDVRAGEDIEFWKKVQKELGVTADGFPGPKTRDALKRAGYKNAQLVKMPQDSATGAGVATAVGIAAIGGLIALYASRNKFA